MRISDWSSDVCSSDLGATDLSVRDGFADTYEHGRIVEANENPCQLRKTIVRDCADDRSAYGVSARGTGGSHRTTDNSGANSRKAARSEEHTSELQSLMRNSYAVFCLKKKNIRQCM